MCTRILMIALFGLFSATLLGAEPLPKAEIIKKLQRTVSFEFVDTPLDDAIRFLNSLTKIPIKIDDPHEYGVRMTPISMRVQDMRLENALYWICNGAKCECVILDGGIEIHKRKPDFQDAVLSPQVVKADLEEVDGFLSKNVTFEFTDTPLTEALDFIRSLTHASIILSPDIEKPDNTSISMSVKEMPRKAALKDLAAFAGLKCEIRRQAVYVFKPEEKK